MLNGLAGVFTPRRVAIVGASERDGTVGRLLWDNLADFIGDVLPVCRSEQVFGHPAYPSLTAVPGDIDLAVLAVPAAGVLDVVRDAAAKGVGAVVVLSAGFAETGTDGVALQRSMTQIATAAGMRIVGPNSFGVQNSGLRLNASIAPGLPIAPGPGQPGISLITQSGAYGMAAHSWGRDESARFAKVYAAGNKADIADPEVLAYLADDPDTGVICLLLESISQPREFFEQARRASARKPVIATVTGRSAAGRRAAWSHTAALGTDEVLRDAMLRQAGVIRTRTGLQMLDAARALIDQPLPAGPRVGIITNSGGVGVELADLLVDSGLTVPVLGDRLQAQLRGLLPVYASAANPVDMTPIWSRFPELYGQLIDLLARSGEVDIVIPVLLQRAAGEPVARAVRAAVDLLRTDDIKVPVCVCWVAPRAARGHADLLQAAGVPCLPWPERTAQAVGVTVRCAEVIRPARAPASRPVHPQRVWAGVPAGVLEQGDLFRAAGITLADTHRCTSPDDAVAAAEKIGYPVVLKVDHPDLPHKSDVDGVRTGVFDQGGVRSAAVELLALASGAAVLVQRQHRGLELVVGGIRNPEFGPLVMVGFGGVCVEALADTSFALAPIDADEATRLWLGLRQAALLNGFRGRPAVDVAAVASLAVCVGDVMVGNPDVGEIDLNPVLALPKGYVVVDWRMNARFSALR